MLNFNSENVKSIMSAAHILTRAALAENSTADYRATFKAALKIVWDNSTNERIAAKIAKSIFGDWCKLSDVDKLHEIQRAAKTAVRKNANRRGLDEFTEIRDYSDDVTGQLAVKAFDLFGGDGTEIYNLALARWNKKSDFLTLGLLLVKLAGRAYDVLKYHDSRASSTDDAKNDDGENMSLYDITPGTYDTERAAILRAEIDTVMSSRDNKDLQIVAGLADGKTEREIAENMTITNVAVHKRIVNLRVAFEAAGLR